MDGQVNQQTIILLKQTNEHARKQKRNQDCDGLLCKHANEKKASKQECERADISPKREKKTSRQERESDLLVECLSARQFNSFVSSIGFFLCLDFVTSWRKLPLFPFLRLPPTFFSAHNSKTHKTETKTQKKEHEYRL